MIKGKKTENEVSPTVRKPTVVNLVLQPRDDILYTMIEYPTHDKKKIMDKVMIDTGAMVTCLAQQQFKQMEDQITCL